LDPPHGWDEFGWENYRNIWKNAGKSWEILELDLGLNGQITGTHRKKNNWKILYKMRFTGNVINFETMNETNAGVSIGIPNFHD